MPDLLRGMAAPVRALAIICIFFGLSFALSLVLWPEEPFSPTGGVAGGIALALLDRFATRRRRTRS